MSARPQKADVIVIGSGIAAYASALTLARSGLRVGLLVEREPERVTLPDFPLWQPQGPRLTAALRGWRAWWEEIQPSLSEPVSTRLEARLLLTNGEKQALDGRLSQTGDSPRVAQTTDGGWLFQGALFDLDRLFAAMAQAITSAGGVVQSGARVRGVSVIEGQILGVISEAARWDARILLNASDDERAMAVARMAREPVDLSFVSVPLVRCGTAAGEVSVTLSGDACWRDADGSTWVLGESPLVRPENPCRTVATVTRSAQSRPPLAGRSEEVRGSWRGLGTAGWPFVALGTAAEVVQQVLESR